MLLPGTDRKSTHRNGPSKLAPLSPCGSHHRVPRDVRTTRASRSQPPPPAPLIWRPHGSCRLERRVQNFRSYRQRQRSSRCVAGGSYVQQEAAEQHMGKRREGGIATRGGAEDRQTEAATRAVVPLLCSPPLSCSTAASPSLFHFTPPHGCARLVVTAGGPKAPLLGHGRPRVLLIVPWHRSSAGLTTVIVTC
jgi:hypothetical protein